jgi:predicted transcriptional regulator
MMSDYTNKFTIAISAPPGALGEYLAALIEYATTHNSSINLHDKDVFNRSSQVLYSLHENNEKNTYSKVVQSIEDYTFDITTEPEIRVISSFLTPAELVVLFPNSKIINIATTKQDANQLGFNHFIKESAMSGKVSPELSKYKSKAEQLFEPAGISIDWDATVRNPMVLDQAPAQYVIKALGVGYCSCAASGAGPWITVNFSELGDVTLKNHAAANANAIAKIYEFIGVQATKDLEVVQDTWVDFMNSFSPYHDIG